MRNSTSAGGLPPWGQIDEELLEDATQYEIPEHWQGAREDYAPWRAGVIAVIDQLLWPHYDPAGTRWESDRVRELNDADFILLGRLHDQFRAAIAAAHPTTVLHADFFDEEDQDGIAFGKGYERYDPQLPRAARDRFPDIVLAALRDKASSVSTQLKAVFQRPRAYQVALLQNRHDFGHIAARTANTPALISGHCFQGAITGCNLFAELRGQMTSQSQVLLQQFTVDIGDRRVFAGVHYPSDNLSSWFTALELVPRVFPSQAAGDVKAFLWTAISTRSTVYRAIEDHAASSGSPYEAMVKKLIEVGNRR